MWYDVVRHVMVWYDVLCLWAGVYTARNAQVAASLLSPGGYQDAFVSLAPA